MSSQPRLLQQCEDLLARDSLDGFDGTTFKAIQMWAATVKELIEQHDRYVLNHEAETADAVADELLLLAGEMGTMAREHWRPPTDCYNRHGRDWADWLRRKAKNIRQRAYRIRHASVAA